MSKKLKVTAIWVFRPVVILPKELLEKLRSQSRGMKT